MKKTEFKKALNLYGSDLKKWPRDLRLAAEKKLVEEKDYQVLLNQEKQFESELKEWAVPAPRSDLEEKILQRAFAEKSFKRAPVAVARPSFFSLRMAASVALLAVGIGFGSHYLQTSTVTADNGQDDYDIATFFVDLDGEAL